MVWPWDVYNNNVCILLNIVCSKRLCMSCTDFCNNYQLYGVRAMPGKKLFA